MKFNSLEALVKHLEQNPKEAIKAVQGQIIADKYCPKCKENVDMQAMDDGKIKCLKCESMLIVE